MVVMVGLIEADKVNVETYHKLGMGIEIGADV